MANLHFITASEICDRAAGDWKKRIVCKVCKKAQPRAIRGDRIRRPNLLSVHHLNNLDIIKTKWSSFPKDHMRNGGNAFEAAAIDRPTSGTRGCFTRWMLAFPSDSFLCVQRVYVLNKAVSNYLLVSLMCSWNCNNCVCSNRFFFNSAVRYPLAPCAILSRGNTRKCHKVWGP